MPSFINSFWLALKNFVDNFNRTTTNNLGVSSAGQTWTALRGTTASTGWYANGTQGKSDANPTTYPIASYDLGVTDTTSKIDSGPGTGVAFWITDANSWWAAYPFYSTSSSSVCNLSLVTSTNNPPSGSCCSSVTTGTTSVCNSGYTTSLSNPPAQNCCSAVGVTTFYTCPSGSYNSGALCYSNTTGMYTGPATQSQLFDCYTISNTITNYSCYTAYTTTYTYTSSIRIISSVSGTVSTDSTTSLGSSGSAHPTIASIEVATSGNTITAKGYSSAGQVSQLGSTITRTPTTPTKGTSVGIIKAPSDEGQSSTVDNYSVGA